MDLGFHASGLIVAAQHCVRIQDILDTQPASNGRGGLGRALVALTSSLYKLDLLEDTWMGGTSYPRWKGLKYFEGRDGWIDVQKRRAEIVGMIWRLNDADTRVEKAEIGRKSFWGRFTFGQSKGQERLLRSHRSSWTWHYR